MTNTAQAIEAVAPPVQTPTPSTSAQAGSQGMTFNQVVQTWIAAGGNPQAAQMAAAVADAESGLNPGASRTNPDGTVGVGLWLIPQNGTPPGSNDPVANARAAIQLSQNGKDWTQWCSAWSDNNCGCSNGTYLGSGANALMSLQTQSGTGSYNVFGSTPSGTGVGASSATSGLTGGTKTSSSSKSLILIGVLVLAVIVIMQVARKRTQGESQEPAPEAPPE